MSYADTRPNYKINSREKVVEAITNQLAKAANRRAIYAQLLVQIEADTLLSGRTTITLKDQYFAYNALSLEYGACLGMLTMAHRLGQLDDIAYTNLQTEINGLIAPIVQSY